MRNFVLFFLMTAFGLSAKAQNDLVIHWLPAVDTMVTGYGSSSASTLTGYMEFDINDVLNYQLTGNSLSTIKQIQFYLDTTYLSSITACKVLIKQGDNIQTASEVANQTVPISNLDSGWNLIDLNNPYAIAQSKNLYIGYQLSFNAGGYPFAVTFGTNSKQGWIQSGNNYGNISSSGFAFLIKAVASTATPPANEIMLSSLDIDQYSILGDSLSIKGTIINFGSTPITSFKISYDLSGVQTVATITGVNVNPNMSYNFTHPQKRHLNSFLFNEVIVVRVFEPNGVADIEFNNTLEMKLSVVAEKVQRVVLHEVFTSSTCPPCKPGNDTLRKVLNIVNDNTKWACIKYQYHFPGAGDPYFTLEGYTRGEFYGGINSVPTLVLDGRYSLNPSFYDVSSFNILAQTPALAKMTGTANFEEKAVTFNARVTPVITINSSNLRFFAAIVEKNTRLNEKTNNEHEFMYVMKKFMSNINGDAISFTADNPIEFNYSYTFKGDYRLPLSAGTNTSTGDINWTVTIDHSKEHSVEDFKNLMVVYWVQDISTGEVLQAGQGYASPVSVADLTPDNSNVSIYPNPVQDVLYIASGANIEKIEVYNLQGQLIKRENTFVSEISTMDLSSGLYMIRVTSDKGVSTHKFIKQ
jgi:hypothetical protein